jgi:hypothetical protein
MAVLPTRSDLELFTGETYVAARAEMRLAQVIQRVRDYCGWHIAGSVTETVTVDGSGAKTLDLPTLRLTAVLSVTEDGETVDLDDVEWATSGYLQRATAWTTKLRGVAVQITHGYTEMPLSLAELVMTAAARGLEVVKHGLVRSQEQIGDYSYNNQYATAGSNQPVGAFFLEHEKKVLDRYAIENPA